MAHIGGFVGGVLLAFVLRAQRAATVEADRSRLRHRADRSPAAALDAADEFLRKHPDDVEALWCKAAALHKMGERDEEAKVLVQLVRKDPDPAHAIDCLVIIEKLRLIPAAERMRLSPSLDGPLRRDVLMNVANEPESEPERPYALLALAEMSEGEERQSLVRELVERYPMHAATEIARTKGLLA
jgi:hypothetical protein